MDEQDKKTIDDDTSCELLNKTYSEKAQSVRASARIVTYRQVLLAALVTPVMISLAHALAYPALIVPQLRNENETLYLNQEEGSWYTSLYSLSSPLGSLIAGFMMDRFGRKITLATPLIPMIITWIVTASCTNHAVLYISRLFMGVFGGFGPPICQIYLAECTDSNFRGVTINVAYVSLSAGFLLTFALGAVMDWRLLAWSGIVLPIVTLLGMLIVPESPVWLLRHGDTDKAYKNLLWLRGDGNIARKELNETLSRINQETDSVQTSWRDFLMPSVCKPIFIIFGFILLFNLSGTYLIIYYAIDILSQVNLTMSAGNASVILSAVRLIVTVGFCWLFLHVKRRQIYLIAGVGSTVSTLLLTIHLYTQSNGIVYGSTLNLWIAGSLLLFYVATNTGFMIAPGFLTGELLPSKIRGRLAGFIYTYFSVVTFILNKFFLLSNAYIGLSGVMLVFGLSSFATTALVYFMVPETKGKSLLEIETQFQSNGWIYKNGSENSSLRKR